MNPYQEADDLLRETGAVLLRKRKHEVWRLPNGRTFVRASTPSDARGGHRSLIELRRRLDMLEERGAPGKRRARKPRPGRSDPFDLNPGGFNSQLADQLRLAGFAEDSVKAQLAAAEEELDALKEQLAELAEELMSEQARLCACRWCGLVRVVGRVKQWLKNLT